MKSAIGLAAIAIAAGLTANARAGEFVSIVQETAVNAPADVAWAKVRGYCDIGRWLNPAQPVPCEVTSGKDGEVGAVRKIAGRVEEVIVATTPTSYVYADTDPKILYHGAIEARSTGRTTSKFIYTLVFDQTSIPAEERAANQTRRAQMFAAVLAAMKAQAEAKAP